MTVNPLMIYLVLHLIPALAGLALGITIVAGLIAFVAWQVSLHGNNGYGNAFPLDTHDSHTGRAQIKKIAKVAWILFLIFLPISVFTPSRDTLVICLVVPALMNSEIAQEIPSDLTQVYELGVDRLIEELTTSITDKAIPQ